MCDAGEVFISDALKTQQLWNSVTGEVGGELTYLKRHEWFRHALFVTDSSQLITTSPKTQLTVWDLSTLESQDSWSVTGTGFGSTVEAMVLTSPDTLRTLSSDGIVEDWALDPR